MTVTAAGLRGGEYVGFGRSGADGQMPCREVPADAERTVAILSPVIRCQSRPALPVWPNRLLSHDPITPAGVAECRHGEGQDGREVGRYGGVGGAHSTITNRTRMFVTKPSAGTRTSTPTVPERSSRRSVATPTAAKAKTLARTPQRRGIAAR
jgi:hypothetical protein